MIQIPESILTSMVEQARRHAPMEACGLLAGTDSTVTKLYEMTNIDQSAEHFSLEPKEQFAAVKDMRACGVEMLAVYHSHPATPARMSEEDIRLAFAPGLCFVIVSLADPIHPQTRAFRLMDGQPVEETVVCLQESAL